ncbi:MAG: hypothetical protein ACXWL5_04625 [Candidatus Chromulinivorax sp.]
MKNFKILFLLFMGASAQIYSGASVSVLLITAYESAKQLNLVAQTDNDDIQAQKLIENMNDCLQSSVNLLNQLQAAKNGLLFKGKPLDVNQVNAEIEKTEKKIKEYKSDIHKLSKNGLAAANHKKILNRRHSRDEQMKALHANQALLKANSSAEALVNSVQALIAQNILAFEQAVESYIATFGQVYQKAGNVYGSTTYISSIYNPAMPITLKEYHDFMDALNKGSQVFGSNVSISLGLNNGVEASLDQVASYVGNVAPSKSFATYAAYGAASLAILAGAAVVGAIAYNHATGQDLLSTKSVNEGYQAAINSASNFSETALNNVSAIDYNALQEKISALRSQLSNSALNAGSYISQQAANIFSNANNAYNQYFNSNAIQS